FLDAGRHWTPALEDAVDRLAQSLPGFHFGRFDVRVPSLDELRRGQGIQVLELNGLTAEATHVYDPANGRLAAYRALLAHWSRAFETAAATHARGARAARGGELRALVTARARARRLQPEESP